ncbi:MAG: cyclic nucleotide-binding domain-containing protein [Deltaproteobacteria bacterium]|nr:MAG: cyclic nucleotide-binding domain-containing protein [Deltaproteobacteria bacterium]
MAHSHPLFAGLNDVDEATALRRCERRTFAAGDVVFRVGAPAEAVLLILDGELIIEVDDVEVGTASGGGVIGEMALFSAGVRTANVVARTASTALILTRIGYEELRDTMHPVAMNLERHALATQIQNLRRVSDRIADLAEGTVAEIRPPQTSFFQAIKALFGIGGGADLPEVQRDAALRASALFGDVPDPALAPIANRMVARAYSAGHFLCTEGQPGDEMYLIVQGQIEVVVAVEGSRVQRLATLREGAAFGLLALAQDRPRMASCIARTKVVVLVLDRKAYNTLAEGPYLDGSAFRRAMLRALSDQLTVANDQLASFEHLTGEFAELKPLLEAASAVA